MRFRTFFSALVTFGCIAFSCSRVPLQAPAPELVAAFSGGVLERTGPIIVEFTRDFDTSVPLSPDVFRLNPPAAGSLSWKNSCTLEFIPSQPLKPGKTYTAFVNPGKLKLIELSPSEDLPEITAFSFAFAASMPTIEMLLDPVRIDNEGMALVSGTVITEEGASNSKIEKTVHASGLGKISWTHDNGEHRFSFRPARTEQSRTVTVNWDGKALGIPEKGSSPVTIPGSAFEVVEIRHKNGTLELVFSSPLKANQDFRGFISLSGNTAVRYSVDGNLLRVFGEQGTNAGITEGALLVIQDLPDMYGNTLAQPVQYTVPGKWELPEARFAGRGTILPTSQGSRMVIETKNLSGILVEAFRIYGSGMIQFLQVNSLDETRELERVGEAVWTKAFPLPWKESDKNIWKRHGLDLSELAKKYPDSMFHLRISFRPRHIQYECQKDHDDFSSMEFPDDSFPAFGNTYNASYWDYWEANYDYTWYEYHNDPCHPAFYLNFYDHNITEGRNVLVSDLGLIAKRGLDGSWFAAASNVKTAKPEANVTIDVLNYQGRSLYKLKTDSSGLAAFGGIPPGTDGTNIPGNHVPAFLYAASGLGRSYLKIAEGTALTVSHFDIGGGKPASGIRGLIYGERGVWRPGDDIFLTFLLSDPEKTLPARHPVSFELEDPRGRIGAIKTYTTSVDGFYPIKAVTQADAPTGNWTARVKVGGLTFTKNLKIETVIPNRLRMDLDFGSAYIEPKHPARLEAAWLYGAPASGLNADISVQFAEKTGVFAEKGDYSFSNPARGVSGELQTVWNGKLDGSGKADFSLSLNPGGAVPGMLNARFTTRVFEPSGAFSTEQIVKDFSPYKRYVGIRLPKGDAVRNMLLTDTTHRADILLCDAEGKPVNGKVDLDCAIYKLEWRWWWEKGGSESAEFASALSRTPVAKGTAAAQNGKASWNFEIKHPDWGRYMVVVSDGEGHSAAAIAYIDWPGWAGRAAEGEGQGAAAMLVLSPDKQQYAAGEKASIRFPSNKEAAALVVIEKGGTILKKEWVRCEDNLTHYEFTADHSMIPNVYVHVSLLQPHLQTQNDLPLRLYGITPVFIDDPRTVLNPVITAAENWEPETEASFTVSEASGRPMAYTVALVDEGLLGLTRFSLPAPRSTFYAREASFLTSWDLFADFMGAYSGQLETLLAIGGGDDEMLDGGKESRRFKPVVQFFGPFEIKAGEKKTERVTLPPYIGALRVMVLAASSTNGAKTNRAYGTAEKQVKVSSDLMVFGTIPRTISPGDEAVIPVSAASYKEGARTVEIQCAVTGASLQSALFGPAGIQKVTFDTTGEKTVLFRIKAPDAPGIIRFTISASSAGLKTARHSTELVVRSTALPVTATVLKLLSPNESWTGTIAYPGMNGTNTAAAEFSRLPPINLEGRLDYLVRYPHGCIEQTTSAVFPQLYLDKVMDMNAARTAEIRANITAGVERIAAFQVPGGGFSYWPGAESADDWGSTYAGHFLIEAKRAGYAVPQDVLSAFISFQKNRASGWASRDGNQAQQAYRLFTLALSGEADLGSMNRLRERLLADTSAENGSIRNLAGWRLAAAYWYAGQRDTARSLIVNIPASVAEYRESSGTYGSASRDRAIVLETLILLGGPEADIKALFEETAALLASDQWLSTQELAHALRAAISYMQGSSSQVREMSVEYVFAGTANSAVFTSQLMQANLGGPAGTSGSFTVRNRSAAPLYARMSVRGLPEEGKEQALSRGLELKAEYRNSSGALINPDALNSGEDMVIRLTVTNTRRVKVENIALVHQLPASWEILNDRIGEESRASGVAYQDIRDDRVMSYFDLNPGAAQTIRVRVHNTYGGTYFRPAIHAYAMYDESTAAVIPGAR